MPVAFQLPGPKAKAIIDRDQEVISPSYPRDYPFVMDYGRGSEVWDVDGNRFLDFAAGIAVTSTGHSHPKVVKAIQTQAEQFIHISSDYYHEKWVALGEKLNSIAPFEEPAVAFMTIRSALRYRFQMWNAVRPMTETTYNRWMGAHSPSRVWKCGARTDAPRRHVPRKQEMGLSSMTSPWTLNRPSTSLLPPHQTSHRR